MTKFIIKTAVFFVFFLMSIDIIGQELYLSKYLKIYKVNLGNCEYEEINGGHAFNDIAFTPDGIMYGLTSNRIVRIDSTGNSTEIYQTLKNGFSGMTSNHEGLLYIVNSTGELYTFDPLTNEEDSITKGRGSSGDITFHNGKIWLGAIGNKIYSIDQDSFEYKLELDLNLDGRPWGLSTVTNNCNNNYGYIVQSGGNNGGTKIFRLNYFTKELSEICHLDISEVWGSAHKLEFINSYDSILPLKIELTEIDTPSCGIANGSLSFDIQGEYDDIDVNFNVNEMSVNDITQLDNIEEENYIITASNEIGCLDTILVNVPCKQSSTSTENNQSKESLIYPNPATSYLFIPELNNNEKLILYNIEGIQFKTKLVSNNKIYVGDLPVGLYILKSKGTIFKFLKA